MDEISTALRSKGSPASVTGLTLSQVLLRRGVRFACSTYAFSPEYLIELIDRFYRVFVFLDPARRPNGWPRSSGRDKGASLGRPGWPGGLSGALPKGGAAGGAQAAGGLDHAPPRPGRSQTPRAGLVISTPRRRCFHSRSTSWPEPTGPCSRASWWTRRASRSAPPCITILRAWALARDHCVRSEFGHPPAQKPHFRRGEGADPGLQPGGLAERLGHTALPRAVRRPGDLVLRPGAQSQGDRLPPRTRLPNSEEVSRLPTTAWPCRTGGTPAPRRPQSPSSEAKRPPPPPRFSQWGQSCRRTGHSPIEAIPLNEGYGAAAGEVQLGSVRWASLRTGFIGVI